MVRHKARFACFAFPILLSKTVCLPRSQRHPTERKVSYKIGSSVSSGRDNPPCHFLCRAALPY